MRLSLYSFSLTAIMLGTVWMSLAPSAGAATAPTVVRPATVTGPRAVGTDLICDAQFSFDAADHPRFVTKWTYFDPEDLLRRASVTVSGANAPWSLTTGDAARYFLCTVTLTTDGGTASSESDPIQVFDTQPLINPALNVVLGLNTMYLGWPDGASEEKYFNTCSYRVPSGTNDTWIAVGGNLRFAYAWYTGDRLLGAGTELGVSVGPGTLARCVITVSNSAGSAMTSSPETVLHPTKPNTVHKPTVVGDNVVGSTVTCSGGTFDTEGWDLAYDWVSNPEGRIPAGNNVIGTGPTYTLTPSDAKSNVNCRLHARHGRLDYVIDSDHREVESGLQVLYLGKHVKRTYLAAALKGGITTSVTCERACNATATLTITAATARRVGLLGAKSKRTLPVVVGVPSAVRLGPFKRHLLLTKFTPAARKNLAKQRAISVTHTVKADGGLQAVTASRIVKLLPPHA